MRDQLDRDSRHEFWFVSGVPSHVLGDLCDSARNSPGDSEIFFDAQVQGQSRQEVFGRFCTALGLDPATPIGRGLAFGYLRRSYFAAYSDVTAQEDVRDRVRLLLAGDDTAIAAYLRGYAEDSSLLGVPIHSDRLRADLHQHGYYVRDLAHDPRTAPALESLRVEFSDSIAPRLIRGGSIPRPEASECLEALAMDEKEVVVLHGAAGAGKSVVLHQLVAELDRLGIPHLPVRLDRRTPANTAREFGEALGLPESPVRCLAHMAGGRRCVLILDQLDAVRWTAAHSSTALLVCKEMLRQVHLLRSEGRSIQLVVACRTYDLEHDFELSTWLQGLGTRAALRVQVGDLPDHIVAEYVGDAYGRMSARQRVVLRNANNLSLWVEVAECGTAPTFGAASQLMDQYWQHKIRQFEAAGCASGDAHQAIGQLVTRADTHGEAYAPASALDGCSMAAVDWLCSLGVLERQGNRVGFVHQSLLDHCIARRVLEQIDRGSTIVEWLGTAKQQTLFRREHLRQALMLLAQEHPQGFADSCQVILDTDSMRYHLKHLVLGLLGQLEQLDGPIGRLCLRLVNDAYWKPRFLRTACPQSVTSVRWLCDAGLLGAWLASGEGQQVDDAVSLLWSVYSKMPDDAAALLRPYALLDDPWSHRVLRVIGWRPASDTASVFELRLCLARHGVVDDFVDWGVLAEKAPLRAILFIEALASGVGARAAATAAPGLRRVEAWTSADLEALLGVATNLPEQTWDLLMPRVVAMDAAWAAEGNQRCLRWAGVELDAPEDRYGLDDGIVSLVIRAGQCMAANPPLLLERTAPLDGSSLPTIQRVIAECYSGLAPEGADHGIRWLMGNRYRLALGDPRREFAWMPAVRLIGALAPYCSNTVYGVLERVVLAYAGPESRRLARDRLADRRERGRYYPYWGREQYDLLDALPEVRRSARASAMLRQLRSMYGEHPPAFVPEGSGFGGFIGSTLERTAERISDRSWLQIVGRKEIPQRTGRWHQDGSDSLVESSIQQFSGTLGRMARRYPERFAQLALRFPDGTHPLYVAAVLDALAHTNPDPHDANTGTATWKPVSPSTVIAVLERFGRLDDREAALSFCRLLAQRASVEWPRSALQRVVQYATAHEDPLSGETMYADIPASEADAKAVLTTSLNCVRAVAVASVGALLDAHADWLPLLEAAIGTAVSDPHVAVRAAAVSALLPLYHSRPEQAIALYCTACQGDPRVAATRHAARFMSRAMPDHAQALAPVLAGMVASGRDDVAEQGARAATAFNLFYGAFEVQAKDCLRGSVAQRQGVAKEAARHLLDSQYEAQCAEILVSLFADEAPEVQAALPAMFTGAFFSSAERIALAQLYLESAAGLDGVERVLTLLAEHKGDLLSVSGVLFDTCERLAALVSTPSTGIDSMMFAREIPSLLMRLYDAASSERSDISDRCLDVLDRLLESDAVHASYLVNAIDS